MASLTGQSISSSYEQLLSLPDGGLNGATLVAITDGDSSTEVAFKISTNALSMNSTNQLQFGDTGTYIHQSADGVLDLVSDTEIEINATTIDMNGALDLSGNATIGGQVAIGASIGSYKLEVSGGDVVFSKSVSSGSGINNLLTIAATDGGVNMGGGEGAGILFKIPDDETNPSIGAQIGAIKESADDSISSTALVFSISQNNETLDEALRIDSTGNVKITSDSNVYLSLDSTQTNGDEWQIFNANSGSTSTLQFKNVDQSKVVMLLDETGKIGVNSTAPVATMDIVGTRTINLTNTTSDDTNKNAVITHSQYDSGTETEGFMLMQGFSNSSTNRIDIGGGNSQHNAAKEIKFHVASDTTTATGTARMVIDDNSRISLSNNDSGGTGGRDSTSGNTILGYNAGNIDAGSVVNTFIGHASGSGSLDDAQNNSAVGAETLQALTTGDSNTVMGAYSGFTLSTGQDNVIIGTDAGFSATTQNDLVLIGRAAGDAINDDGANGTVAIGKDALTALVSGQKNTAIGYNTLSVNNDIGDSNTAVGYEALKNFNPSSDGHGLNTAVGASAGEDVSTGTGNTLIGDKAGNTGSNDITTGTLNTVVGQLSGISASDGTNQTVIGRGATGQADNSVTLGNADVTDVYMAQDSGATVHAGGMHIEKPNAQPILLIGRAESDFSPGIADNDILGELQFAGHEGSNTPNVVAKVLGVADESFGSTSGRGELQFQTGDESSTTTKMTITSSGVIDLPFGQLKFPATQSASADANTLDDYEEGTFTPVWSSASGTLGSINYTSRIGRYTKIGDVVHFSISFYNASFDAGSGSGQARLSGLPFTCNSTNGKSACSVGISQYFTGQHPSTAEVLNNQTSVDLLYRDSADGATALLQVADLQAGGSGVFNLINVSGTYFV